MTNNFKIFICAIVICLSSCIGENTEYKSRQGVKHFSAKKTCDILLDIHKADAMIATNVFVPGKSEIKDTLIYDIIFDKYSCTREEFYESLLYHVQYNIDSINYYYDKNLEKISEEQVK